MRPPQVALTFNSRQVGLAVVKQLSDVHQEVEKVFGLQFGSYDIFDKCGKIEGEALERVLRMAGANATCQLEVREHPEWKKMRELEERISMIASGKATIEAMKVSERMEWQKMRQLEARVEAVATDSTSLQALQSFEQRILSKVGKIVKDAVSINTYDIENLSSRVQEALIDVQRIEEKVDSALAPLVESLAFAQLDIQAQLQMSNSQIADLTAKASKLDGALAQLDNFNSGAVLDQVDHLEERVASLSARLARRESPEFEKPVSHQAAVLEHGCPWGWDMKRSATVTSPSKESYIGSAMAEDLGPMSSMPTKPHVAQGCMEQEQHVGGLHVRMLADGRVLFAEGGKKGDPSPLKPGRSRRRGPELPDATWGELLAAPPALAPVQHRKLERRSQSGSLLTLPPVF